MKRMKWLGALVLTAGMIVLLLSCAGLPKPTEDTDTLVIGTFVVDFPEGFFDLDPRRIINSVKLDFLNVTTKERFTVRTYKEYFYFPARGLEEFVLESFEYSTREESKSDRKITEYSFGPMELNFKIRTKPKSVVYLGHLTFVYSNPTIKKHGRYQYYDYEKDLDVQWDRAAVVEYLKGSKEGEAWLAYEVVESR